MTNIELQAYEAIKAIARQSARMADALERIADKLTLKPPEADADAKPAKMA